MFQQENREKKVRFLCHFGRFPLESITNVAVRKFFAHANRHFIHSFVLIRTQSQMKERLTFYFIIQTNLSRLIEISSCEIHFESIYSRQRTHTLQSK